jgi:uncharacterized protein YjiS (DUF1127 family)
MINKKEIQKVFDRLSDEKIELERVELNMINDIKKAIEEYGLILLTGEEGFYFVVKAEKEYKDSLNKYEKLIKNINKLSQKFESELKNIGISKKDAGVWTYMDSLDRTKEKTEKRISILKRNINDLTAIKPN